jgi:hypothetical protein
VPRLRRRFGCGAREAAGLAELFIGLDAGPGVVAWYEAEARRHGVAGVIEDLVRLVEQVSIAEAVSESDAFDEAERLGDDAEAVNGDGVVAQLPEQSGVERAWVAWHALGYVQPERVECPGCRAVYVVDDEAAELPVCPACGVADTWEARQGAGFRADWRDRRVRIARRAGGGGQAALRVGARARSGGGRVVRGRGAAA